MSEGPKNVGNRHLDSFCLGLSLPFDQHSTLDAGLDPGSQCCFQDPRGKSHELSFSLCQFPECGIFDVLEEDFG